MSRQNSINLEQKNSKDLINGSEINNKENLEVNQSQKDLISKDAERAKHKTSSHFGIDALELEELMGKYKERGADFHSINIIIRT